MQGIRHFATQGLAIGAGSRPFLCLNQISSRRIRPLLRLHRRLRMSSAQANAQASTPSEQDAVLERFYQHQNDAARLSMADEARLLIDLSRTGVLSTVGSSRASSGFPVGSVVELAADSNGRPTFSLSSRSAHTKDLHADPRCSLTVTSPNFEGMADARFVLVGKVQPVPNTEQNDVRQAFLKKHPDSYWVNFGDFNMFRMEEVVEGRFNGGFGRAATLSSEDYAAAQPDPVAAFSAPIAKHMNEDHANSITEMVRHFAGLPAERAEIADLDRLGMNVKATWNGELMSVRLPYPRPAEDRKSTKDLIVEMTREASKAAPKS